ELRESFCMPPPWPSPASGGGDAPSAERQFAASTETCSEFFAFRPALSLGRTAIRRTQNNSALLRTSLRRAGILHAAKLPSRATSRRGGRGGPIILLLRHRYPFASTGNPWHRLRSSAARSLRCSPPQPHGPSPPPPEWPSGPPAQKLPVIGFLTGAPSAHFTHFLAAFRKGLGEAGYAEGRNVAIESRYADGRYDRLPALTADLVNQRVAAIV